MTAGFSARSKTSSAKKAQTHQGHRRHRRPRRHRKLGTYDMSKSWPALVIRSNQIDDSEELISAVLSDFALVAIQELAERPLPPGGLWDPTHPPIPDPPRTP